jgi:hypothetical protein
MANMGQLLCVRIGSGCTAYPHTFFLFISTWKSKVCFITVFGGITKEFSGFIPNLEIGCFLVARILYYVNSRHLLEYNAKDGEKGRKANLLSLSQS